MRLILLLTLLASTSAFGQDQVSSPIVITSFSGREEKPLRSDKMGAACFTVQFRVKEHPLFEVERAVVYLFDRNGKLIHTLTEIDSGSLPRGDSSKHQGQLTVNYPNLLSSLEGLQPDVIYTIQFRHMLEDPSDEDEVRSHAAALEWKYAVVVLGADDRYVYRVFPAWKKVEELEFREKSKGVEQR